MASAKDHGKKQTAIFDAAIFVWGAGWGEEVAAVMDISSKTARRYASGDRGMSLAARTKLKAAMAERRDAISKKLAALGD